MKKEIHPNYYADAKIICACGNSFITGSTQKETRVELCSACHPFYTGKQKIVDTARRVEKFKEKMAMKETLSKTRKGRTLKRKIQKTKKAKDVEIETVKKMSVKK